jgi:hypothetical protein
MIIGDADHARREVKRWEDAGVTMLLVTARTASEVTDIGALLN